MPWKLRPASAWAVQLLTGLSLLVRRFLLIAIDALFLLPLEV